MIHKNIWKIFIILSFCLTYQYNLYNIETENKKNIISKVNKRLKISKKNKSKLFKKHNKIRILKPKLSQNPNKTKISKTNKFRIFKKQKDNKAGILESKISQANKDPKISKKFNESKILKPSENPKIIYENKGSIKSLINELMQKYQIPGAAIAVRDHDKTNIYVFGKTNKKSNKPITLETPFEIGSIGKTFTALLCSLDLKNLDENLIKYYPEIAKNKFLKDITFEDLLTHTSGLPFNPPKNLTTKKRLQNYLLNWKTNNFFQWQYSNLGIGLAGIGLEKKNYKHIDELYKKYILNQLDMPHTKVENLASSYYLQGHTKYGKKSRIICQTKIFKNLPAAGLIESNIQDMSKFLDASIGLKNIPDKIKKAIQNTQTARIETENFQQGLGWEIHSLDNQLNKLEKLSLGPIPAKQIPKNLQKYDPNKLIDKTGTTDGFKSYIAVIPGRKQGVVILLNKIIPHSVILKTGRKILFEKLL